MNIKDSHTLKKNKIPHSDYILLLAISIIGGLFIVIATGPYGVGISADSVTYISVSRNFTSGLGLLDYNMNPLVSYPPMYSILVSVFSNLLNKDPIQTIPFLNAILFAATIFLSGIFLKNTFQNRAVYLLGLIPLLFSASYLRVFTMAWTEPLFIVITIGYFLILQKYLDTKRLSQLIWLSIVITLACLTRYVGITLYLCTIICQIFLINQTISDRIKHLTIVSIIPGLTFASWLFRNNFLTGSMTGSRMISNYSLVDNLISAIDTLLSWFLPERLTESRYIYPFLVIFFLGNLYLIIKNRKLLQVFISSLYKPIVVFIIIYLGFLLLTSQTSFWQLIDNRYLTPIYLPVAAIFYTYVLVLYSFFVIGSNKPMRSIPVFLFIIWLIFSIYTSIGVIKTHFFEGSGYSSKIWRSGQMINFISTQLSDYELYSNGIEVIYFITGTQSKSLPTRPNIDEIKDAISNQNACFLWFNNIDWRKYYYHPNEIAEHFGLKNKVQLDDGTIYCTTKN